jgi:arylsulfatase A-like enzyme
MVGKGSFYESSIRIPLVVRIPGQQPQVRTELVSLGDLTATILSLAGCRIPEYADSRVLPGVHGLSAGAVRHHLVGTLSEGWMIYDGRWKLAKYITGEVVLFDLLEDPEEQNNLAGDRAVNGRLLELDSTLSREIQASLIVSHHDRKVYSDKPPTEDEEFGRRGWRRTYPRSVMDSLR